MPQVPHQILHVTFQGSDGATLSFNELADLASVSFEETHHLRILANHVEAALAVLRLPTESVTIAAKAPYRSSPHEFAVNYAVEPPVPKITYRILLPPSDGSGSVTVQGWVVVENPSDYGIFSVDVSTVSGLPFSFSHKMYEPRY